jgi:hypothetical protein
MALGMTVVNLVVVVLCRLYNSLLVLAYSIGNGGFVTVDASSVGLLA